jgi:TonB-linked SusC/RagA family outer membrane protein
MKKLYINLTVLASVLLLNYSHAQTLKVEVYDAQSHQGIAGAAINISPNHLKRITDNLGHATLNLSIGKYLILVKSLGYQTQQRSLELFGDTLLRVSLLPQSEQLDSVVISTGYQTLAKERATGSFSVINSKRYNEQIGTNALERLRYITNGVAPVADRITNLGKNAMLIRGMSTLSPAIQQPLIILDGFEYQGDLDNINPNDIENITFLKDAAAGSIWGAKAANGVIVLNTKKGNRNDHVMVNVTANFTVGAKPNLYYDRQIAPQELIAVEQFLFANKYKFADTARTTRPPFSDAYELMFAHKNGKMTDAQLAVALAMLGEHDVRDDFNKYFYQNELNQQFAMNISGGSSLVSWYISAGRDQNLSHLDAKYNRNTLRLSNQFRISPSFSASLAVAYTGSNSQSGKPAYGDITLTNSRLPSYTALADGQGNALPLYAYYRKEFIDNIGNGKLLDWRYYPLTDYNHSRTENKVDDINVTLGLEYHVLDWLKLSANYRLQKQVSVLRTLNTVESYYTRNLINLFTQVAPNGMVTNKVPLGDILDHTDVELTAQNLRAQLNVDKYFGQLGLVTLAGAEWSEKINTGLVDRYYGYNEDLLLSVPVDVINQYPSYMTGGNANIPSTTNFRGTNNRFASVYANAALSFKDKYTLSASARRDASNLFGQATNDRWKPLWSIGAAWLMTKETWLKTEKVQQLKLRASYGRQGNIDPAKVAVTTLTYGSNNAYTLTPIGQINNYPNPDLRWEQVAMFNLGVDFSALNGKLSGSIEHYRKHMTDLYANVQVDRTTGIASGSVTRNVGQAKGSGWDVELRATQKIGAIGLSSDLIFNTYTDKVTKLNTEIVGARQLMSAGFGVVQDYAIYALFAYKWGGLDPTNGDPIGYFNNQQTKDYSQITNQTLLTDAEYLGSQLPRYYGSLGFGLNWQHFSLSARFSYKLAYHFRRNSIDYGTLISQLSGHEDYANRWKQVGDESWTEVPSFVYPINSLRDNFYTNSAKLFERGDHLRLQYVRLSYQLDRQRQHWLPIKNLNIIFAANELGVLWRANRLGLDPDAGLLPRPIRTSFGLTSNF